MGPRLHMHEQVARPEHVCACEPLVGDVLEMLSDVQDALGVDNIHVDTA